MRGELRAEKRAALLVGGVIISGVMALSLTMTRPPSPEVADEIDRLLEQDPCVGSSDRWPSRYYAWERPAWSKREAQNHFLWLLSGPWLGSDTSRVTVSFHERASPDMYLPSRHLLRADQEVMWLDSSNDLSVFGTYDVRTRKFINLTCGPNYP